MKRSILIIFIYFLSIGIGKTQIHPITIHSNQRVASLQMTVPEYNSWIAKDEFSYNDVKRQALVRDIYQKFEDKFDFIFLILNEAARPPSIPNDGVSFTTSNATRGIGLPLSNTDAAYGSAGKLKAIIELPCKNYLLYGPSLHEIMHTWGNYVIPSKDWNGFSDYDAIPHWGFTGGNNKGQLGGFKQSTLQTNIGGDPDRYRAESFGGFANGGNSVPYSDFELYLMGLIPLTDVGNFDVFKGLSNVNVVGSNIEFNSSSRVTYNNEKILEAAGGTRNPSYTASQKSFRALIVVLTTAPLNSTEWTDFDDQSEKFSRPSTDNSSLYNFWEATRGLATLETGSLLNSVRSSFPQPRNFSANVQGNKVILNWNLPLITNQTLMGYNVYLTGNDKPINEFLINDTIYQIPVPGQDYVYTYKIKAIYKTGESDPVSCIFRNANFPYMSDSLALVALYKQCNGVNWTRKANWLSGPLSTWEGIKVENGRVVELIQGDFWRGLTSANLTGSIPAELLNLTELRILDLSNNKLNGTLPQGWSVFKKLRELYLYSNQFTGSLPESWSELSNIRNLNISDNQLSGSLPPGWSGLVNLLDLRLVSNKLTGVLPETWSGLANLIVLFLDNNQFTGTLLASWSELSKLEVLSLGQNELSGTLPDSWATLVNIKKLMIWSNQLTGPLPESWSALENLELLWLYRNNLTGVLPAGWSALKNLFLIDLAENKLSGTLPESWSGLKKLWYIQIGYNQLTGTLPESWSALVNLNTLSFYNNQLSGSLPESWSSLVNLSFFSFGKNRLTGILPGSWSSMVNLGTLYLNDNNLSGSLPVSWSSMRNLQFLYLNGNSFTGNCPDEWRLLSKIQSLYLDNNQITGLPDFSSMPDLKNLYVANNWLDFGDIEPNIGVSGGEFWYHPQHNIGESATIVRKKGEEFRISFNIGGKSNKYQWYKNWISISGANGNEYVIPSVSSGDAGIYSCNITNTVATQLTLYSNPITLQIQTDTKAEDPELCKAIKIYPNPFINELIIKKDGYPDNETFTVLNSIGQLVVNGNLANKTVINTSDFAPGVYLIKIESGLSFIVRKIIKI